MFWKLYTILISFIVAGIFKYFQSRKLTISRIANEKLLAFQRNNETKVLYLRDFVTDGLKYKTTATQYSTIQYVDTNFETTLSLKVGRLGHFISIGYPSYVGDI